MIFCLIVVSCNSQVQQDIMNEKCLQIIVKGRVQGVFFRKYTKITADNLGINGFVRNEQDGSVYIEACGDSVKLNQFIEWCHQGPDQASVDIVETNEIEQKTFSSFSITYF